MPSQNGNNEVFVPAGSFSTSVELVISMASVPTVVSQSAIKATSIGLDITNYQSASATEKYYDYALLQR